MEAKRYIHVEFARAIVKYGAPIPLVKLEEIFQKVKDKYPEYSDIAVEFCEDPNDGDYGSGIPEAHLTFFGDRLEMDAEYQRRLETEIAQEQKRQIKEKQEILAKTEREAEQKKWDRQYFERLKKKYGW